MSGKCLFTGLKLLLFLHWATSNTALHSKARFIYAKRTLLKINHWHTVASLSISPIITQIHTTEEQQHATANTVFNVTESRLQLIWVRVERFTEAHIFKIDPWQAATLYVALGVAVIKTALRHCFRLWRSMSTDDCRGLWRNWSKLRVNCILF